MKAGTKEKQIAKIREEVMDKKNIAELRWLLGKICLESISDERFIEVNHCSIDVHSINCICIGENCNRAILQSAVFDLFRRRKIVIRGESCIIHARHSIPFPAIEDDSILRKVHRCALQAGSIIYSRLAVKFFWVAIGVIMLEATEICCEEYNCNSDYRQP